MEDYQIIASQIGDIRFNLNRIGLKLPENATILKAFEELSIYVIKNFEIPGTHIDYIFECLDMAKVENSSSMIDELISINKSIEDRFAIEIKLRAIESYFSWGRPSEIELEKLVTLKYLIAKLHALIGDITIRYKMEVI